VSGEWFAKGSGGRGCPPDTPCNATGGILGFNSVAQIQIELHGAGKFEGGLTGANRLRGIFATESAYDTITFVRQGQ
jgi:hypothetical protein